MRISDMLFETAQELWDEAAEKTFVKEMAEGSLDEGLFRRYMIQDYLYLLDYIDTLRLIKSRTEDAELRVFLDAVIAETENETYRVHVPHMKQLLRISSGLTRTHAGSILKQTRCGSMSLTAKQKESAVTWQRC